MSLYTPYVRSPICYSCTRRIFTALLAPTASQWPILNPVHNQQQVRGKKRSNKGPDNIVVRLRKDVPGYGRSGSYVPISAGRMRNDWTRQDLAVYLSHAEQRDIQARSVPVQRDVLFQAELVGKSVSKRRRALVDAALRERGDMPGPGAEEGDMVAVERAGKDGNEIEVLRVEPQRSIELIGVLLPHRLDFRRQRQSDKSQNIFGSVSSADVVQVVRETLGNNDEASRITVVEEDVKFVGEKEGESLDRLKQLGQFKVEIRVKGSDGVVTRPVNVLPQQEDVKEAKEARPIAN